MAHKNLYTVIHCGTSDEQAERRRILGCVDTALSNGADGVFLVNDTIALIGAYALVRKTFPAAWIGLRFQSFCPNTDPARLVGAANECPALNALWTDKLPLEPLQVKTKIFGGMSIIYSKGAESELGFKLVCDVAATRVHVATILSPETGVAPSMALVGGIRHHLPSTRIAIAGGVTRSVVSRFRPSVDDFIVGSHVAGRDQSGQVRLLPERVAELAREIHG